MKPNTPDPNIRYSGEFGIWKFHLTKTGEFYVQKGDEEPQKREWHKTRGRPWIPPGKTTFIEYVRAGIRAGEIK